MRSTVRVSSFCCHEGAHFGDDWMPDVGIRAEALAPEPVGQEHHVLLAWLILIGSEITPKNTPVRPSMLGPPA
jgi:hypothetical protein